LETVNVTLPAKKPTHIAKIANIRKKLANPKMMVLRGEILVKIVALPVHEFNSAEHCVCMGLLMNMIG
jgi:hypothetical protein